MAIDDPINVVPDNEPDDDDLIEDGDDSLPDVRNDPVLFNGVEDQRRHEAEEARQFEEARQHEREVGGEG